MSYELSAGAIIYRVKQDGARREPYYLLLRYPGGYWEFARGHVEAGEHEHATAQREIQEETGLTGLRFARGFREKYRFHFKRTGKMVTKDAVIYLAEAQRWGVRVSEEHYGYVWAAYREALRHLHFDNSKQVLRKAHAFLQQRKSQGRERQSAKGGERNVKQG